MDQEYYYGNGEDIIFDDVVWHSVRNDNNARRISLFLDVRRWFNNTFVDALNGFVLWGVTYNPHGHGHDWWAQ